MTTLTVPSPRSAQSWRPSGSSASGRSASLPWCAACWQRKASNGFASVLAQHDVLDLGALRWRRGLDDAIDRRERGGWVAIVDVALALLGLGKECGIAHHGPDRLLKDHEALGRNSRRSDEDAAQRVERRPEVEPPFLLRRQPDRLEDGRGVRKEPRLSPRHRRHRPGLAGLD